MREIERIDRILGQIAKLWKAFPDQRFFQLMMNYSPLIGNYNGTIKDPFNLEDDDLEEYLTESIKHELER